MHPNSMQLMKQVISIYCLNDWCGHVLEVGSLNINGSYRKLFGRLACRYIGLDMQSGKGVDIVADILDGLPMFGAEFDMIISGQMLEHCLRPWKAVEIMSQKLAPKGILVLIAPWQIPIHRRPIDCWRILPDGMRLLLEDAGLVVEQCEAVKNDTIGIGRKPC